MPGTTDGAPPETFTAAQLSRVKDLLDAAAHVDTYCNARTQIVVWNALPIQLKVEFNYSKWDYVPKR